MREDEVKVEGSIPAQARINIVSLANLDLYWASEGYQIRTMSQLINFSIELLCEILESNKKIRQKVDTIALANKYLMERGLYQKGMRNRGHKKLGMAIAFEGMRAEGMRPESYAPKIYERMHRGSDHKGNPTTVQPFTGKVSNSIIDRATEIYDNLKSEDVKPIISQEFAMRDKTLSDKFKAIDEADKAQADALKDLDIPALMAGAVKEKIVE